MSAVITRSGQTLVLAGITRLVVSGQDSYQTTSTPADGALTIADWKWSWSDGVVQHGALVTRTFPVAATYSVTLLVTFRSGSPITSNISDTVTVSAPVFEWTKYVRSDGNDATGDGSANDAAHAYQTIERAFYDWRNGSGTIGAGLGRILFNDGDDVTYAALSTGNHFPDADYGPLLITTVGGGRATLTCTNSAINDGGFDLAEDGTHDGGAGGNYAHPVFWDGIDFNFTANHGTDDSAGGNALRFGHNATQLSNSTVTNCALAMKVGASIVAYNVDVSGAYRNGAFFSATMSALELANIHGNGHLEAFDGQVYASEGCVRAGIIDVTCDGTGSAGSIDAFHFSGCHKLYVAGCFATNQVIGYDCGANDDQSTSTQDLVIERCQASAVDVAFWFHWCDRVSIRDTFGIGVNGLGTLVLQSYSTARFVDHLEFLDSSYSNVKHGILYAADSEPLGGGAGLCSVGAVKIQNVALRQKSSGTGVTDSCLFQIPTDTSPIGRLTADHNRYYRVGDGAGTASFVSIAGVMKSFTQWQGAPYNQDASSTYGDQGYANPDADLHLAGGSACIDAGFDNGLLFDADGNPRKVGAAVDVGAFERSAGEQPLFLTSIDRQFIIV